MTANFIRLSFLLSTSQLLNPSTFLHLVIFDHRIRKQVAAKIVESLLHVFRFIVDLDLEKFSDPDRTHFRHPEMLHRVAHRRALRIEHRSLRSHNDVNLHAGISGGGWGWTSAIVTPIRAPLPSAFCLPAVQ